MAGLQRPRGHLLPAPRGENGERSGTTRLFGRADRIDTRHAAGDRASRSARPDAPPPPRPGPPPATSTTAVSEKVVVTTDVMKLTFDTEGGSLIRTEFLQEPSDDRQSNYVLLNETAGHMYVAESGLIGGDYPNHKTPMTFSGDKQLKD